MCFYFENPYTGAILRFCLVACWTRRINMESPQTVPKDTLLKQIPPGNLLLSPFQTLSFQNDIPIPSI